MRARTLARRRMGNQTAGWAHPYETGIFSPVWYADGGDAGSGQAEDAGKDDKPDTGGKSDDSGKTDEADTTDWKAEAEKYKALSRKHEARAKENSSAAKERDELRKQSMTEQEKAVEEASAKARTEERVRLAGKLARQGFLAAAAGRIPHAASVADDLNLAKYVGEDGEIDESGLAELVDRLAPPKAAKSDKDGEDGGEKKAKQNGSRGFDQGPRGSGSGKESSLSAGRELYAQRKNTTSIT
ncbi:hypothetical protein [Streptomyces scabiei]|uniref:hypothetical protein n=1 Tax=Streptomyces scabiei TaxID=1930 RepID=UPI0029ADF1F8|nr:hypothetical protein [Streptomyces scabiei]MDX3027483.1 hypothetical protein [Streptomyces scabiei]